MSSVFLRSDTGMLLKEFIEERDIIESQRQSDILHRFIKRDLASIRMTEAMTSSGVFPAAFLIVEQK